MERPPAPRGGGAGGQRATGERRYLRLAHYFVDERGRQPHYFDAEARARGEDPARWYFKTYAYMQAHCPVREQTEVVGHAVRATYLYSAMTDLARELGDNDLRRVCERLWRHLVSKRLYVTGGIGSSASNEGFTRDYDLPEDAYAETCAAIGLIFWSHRMLQLTGDGACADVLERALYNGALSGVSLDGRRFFYVNPLSSRGEHERQEWYDCACCPPNTARLLASVGTYFYRAILRLGQPFERGNESVVADGRRIAGGQAFSGAPQLPQNFEPGGMT